GSSLDGGRELVRESAPKQLANSRANSCCRHPHASTSSRDIAARSVRAISFRRGSNRRGTKTVESRSNPSASPNSPLTPSPIPPHATDENGGCERLRHPRRPVHAGSVRQRDDLGSSTSSYPSAFGTSWCQERCNRVCRLGRACLDAFSGALHQPVRDTASAARMAGDRALPAGAGRYGRTEPQRRRLQQGVHRRTLLTAEVRKAHRHFARTIERGLT